MKQLWYWCLIGVGVLYSFRPISGSSTTPSCTPIPVCSSSELTEITSCTVSADQQTIQWRVFQSDGLQLCQIILSNPNLVNQPVVDGTSCSAVIVSRSNTHTSTISMRPTPELDGATILCYVRNFLPSNLVKECHLDLITLPLPPGCGLTTNEDVIIDLRTQTVSIPIRWTESLSEASITGYSINVNPLPSVFPTECGGTTNPCMMSPDVRELQFQLVLSMRYIVSISAINQCNQTGVPRDYIIDTKVPAPQPNGTLSNAVNVVYDSSGTLTSITVAWRPVNGPHAMTGCDRTLLATTTTGYRVNVTGDGSVVSQTTLPPCTTDCSYTYSPPDNSPSDQYRVMVAAENVFGLGAEFMTQNIRMINDIMTVVHSVGLTSFGSFGSPAVNISCQFLPLFNGTHTCTLHYGTSPTNLEFTTGLGVVFMLDDLVENEEYFYEATAEHQHFTVSVVGRFTTCSPPPPPPDSCTVEVDGPVTTYNCSDVYKIVGESSTTMCTDWSMAQSSRAQCQSQSSSAGVTIGVTFVVSLLLGIVIGGVSVVLFGAWQQGRKKPPSTKQDTELKETAAIYEEPDLVTKQPDDMVITGNVAYGPVNTHQ